MIELTL